MREQAVKMYAIPIQEFKQININKKYSSYKVDYDQLENKNKVRYNNKSSYGYLWSVELFDDDRRYCVMFLIHKLSSK